MSDKKPDGGLFLSGSSANSASLANPGNSLVFVTGLRQRVKGLLFCKPHNKIVVLVPCRDVHTVGMKYHIDVAFINKRGVVVAVHQDIAPFNRLRNVEAVAVAERFSEPITPWLKVGDYVGIFSNNKGEENERVSGMQFKNVR